jgi:hypothetical protein
VAQVVEDLPSKCEALTTTSTAPQKSSLSDFNLQHGVGEDLLP